MNVRSGKNVAVGILMMLAVCLGGLIQVQAAVSLNQKTVTICVNQKNTLKLAGTTKQAKWSSSNKKVAKVSSKGVVTGVKKGKATVTAKLGKKKYSCKVTVNNTYGANTTAISLRNKSKVKVRFLEDDSVTFKIKNKQICSAVWGDWNGNEIPLVITPKKIGSTSITCSNAANDEQIEIKVTVTGVPIKVSGIATASSDQGDFVCGLNSMNISFKQDRKSQNTILYLMSKEDEIIRTMKLGSIGTKKATASWNGMTDKGERYEGDFRIRISADDYVTDSADYKHCYAQSPFAGGNGTSQQPYEVATEEQLKKIPAFNGRFFRQTGDIDLHSKEVSSLFTEDQPFQGLYDGSSDGIVHVISGFNGYSSLFGAIGSKGTVRNLTLHSFSLLANGKQQAAIVAEINSGTIEACTIENGFVYSTSNTDAALLVIENNGLILQCNVEGILFSYGNLAGGAIRNKQRMVDCQIQANIHFIATSGISTGSTLRVGGIAAENASTAFIVGCKSDGSYFYTNGSLPSSSRLYIGGIVGSNAGQIQEGSYLGRFGEDYMKDFSGALYAGMLTGENRGVVSDVSYYKTTGCNTSGLNAGTEINLNAIDNPYEVKEEIETPTGGAVIETQAAVAVHRAMIQ